MHIQQDFSRWVQQPTDGVTARSGAGDDAAVTMREGAMDDRQLNPLKTGMLFVAPGLIMDRNVTKLPHHSDHLDRLKADVGLDALEEELAPVARPSWSFHQLLVRISEFFYRRRAAST